MNAERWKKIDELYHAALERQPQARPAFLIELCGNDIELRREVESLLAETDDAADFMERPAMEVAAELFSREGAGALTGHSLNHHRVLSLLGTGGMAEVYRARDTRLDRDVAIKVLHATAGVDADYFSRFHREARMLAALKHPNIGAIYGFEQEGGICALILELIEGETLSERLERGRLSIDEALNIARQIAVAVEAAHAREIIHRDLKPANIKIAPDGAVTVLDFGLAKLLQPAGVQVTEHDNTTAEGVSDAGDCRLHVAGASASRARR